MTDRATVILVRHGETGANLAGLWQGATDTELTEAGATRCVVSGHG